MMKRLQAFALLVVFMGLIGGVLYLWWSLDLRWRPHVIRKNQAQIATLLSASDWVSPGKVGPKLYLIAYRDCEPCNRYAASELAPLQKAGIDTRVILIARPDVNGQARSSAAERSTVAELWINRNWALYQRWSAGPAAAWTAQGIAAADGDVARSAVIEAGRDMVERLAPLLKANGVRFAYPILVWWAKDGRMEACACTAPQSWGRVRADIGAE